MDETELARDEVNDLPGDERDAGTTHTLLTR